jgi:hypothetical protein
VVVIDYETFSKIHDCHNRQGLTIAQTARALGLNSQTVAKWLARSRFERRGRTRGSILDPYKPHITKLLEAHPYSVDQIFLRLCHKGYMGGLTILRDYIRCIRPSKISVKPRRHRGHWTRARIKEVASTCSTLGNFRKLYATAYNTALKKGWMPEVCPHLRFVSRPSSTYTLRTELAEHPKLDTSIARGSEKPSFVVPANSICTKDTRSNWSRDFSVPDKYTLEQLNEIILCLLGWDRCHLYKFRIASRVHANLVLLDEDDPCVEIDYPCVSCDIPLREVGLSVGDKFTYVFDFVDYHLFLLTVLARIMRQL